MIAQTGLDQLIAPLLTPFVILWWVGAGMLLSVIVFVVFVTCARAWNRRPDDRRAREHTN